jgi:predicted AAA+ superfamily ATPase
LREGKPLDASEFAVHLDHMRDGRFPKVYQNPEQFFERTFLMKNLNRSGGRGAAPAFQAVG